MIVWFHSTLEQERDAANMFSYDTMMDSKLFASLSSCEQDAIDAYQEDLKESEKYYGDALRRRDIAKQALTVLEDNNVDVSELYWMNYASNEPEFHKPPARYIYSLDIIE